MIFEARPYDDPDVVRLVAEVQQEYVAMYGGPDIDTLGPGEFVLPDGLFLIGVEDGRAVATGAWRRRSAHEAEIKRMFVSVDHRGRGSSRLVLAEIERTAADAGVSRLVLSTGRPQRAAIALYASSGYEPCEPFGTYARHRGVVFLAKSIEPAPLVRDGLG